MLVLIFILPRSGNFIFCAERNFFIFAAVCLVSSLSTCSGCEGGLILVVGVVVPTQLLDDLIVVDARYHRRSMAGSRDDPDAILGAPQWAWLEGQVSKSDAPYLAVASSSTFHAFGDESWELCRPAFDRMVKLLRDRPGALVLSGDAHRNAVYDDSGVIEIVSSAVARRSLVFKVLRSNYGILSFDDDGLRVQLHSLKVSSRFDFRIERSHWTLP
jgi:hypothetical protein